GEDVVIGVNKYPLDEHAPIDTLEVDNHKVREGQIARIAAVRAERDEARCRAALEALTAAAQNPPLQGEGDHPKDGGGGSPETLRPAESRLRQPPAASATSPSRGESNLLALAIEAARADATLGEISAALETGFGRYGALPAPVRGVYSASYEGDPRYAQVTAGVEAVTRRLGRPP